MLLVFEYKKKIKKVLRLLSYKKYFFKKTRSIDYNIRIIIKNNTLDKLSIKLLKDIIGIYFSLIKVKNKLFLKNYELSTLMR